MERFAEGGQQRGRFSLGFLEGPQFILSIGVCPGSANARGIRISLHACAPDISRRVARRMERGRGGEREKEGERERERDTLVAGERATGKWRREGNRHFESFGKFERLNKSNGEDTREEMRNGRKGMVEW